MIKFKHSFNTNSQAGQDLFVTNITSNKVNGYYVEVGSSHSKTGNNTYLLEKTLNNNIHFHCYEIKKYTFSFIKFINVNN